MVMAERGVWHSPQCPTARTRYSPRATPDTGAAAGGVSLAAKVTSQAGRKTLSNIGTVIFFGVFLRLTGGTERRKATRALRSPPAQPYRRDDLLVRPAANPRGLVGRDVRRVHGPEGPFELLAARVGLALGLGMAAAAARGAEDVLAAGDLGGIGGEGGAGPPGHEAGHEKKSAHGSYPNAEPPSAVPTSFELIEETCRRRRRSPAPRSRAPRMPPRPRERACAHRPAPPW